jgi:hypothetical protein
MPIGIASFATANVLAADLVSPSTGRRSGRRPRCELQQAERDATTGKFGVTESLLDRWWPLTTLERKGLCMDNVRSARPVRSAGSDPLGIQLYVARGRSSATASVNTMSHTSVTIGHNNSGAARHIHWSTQSPRPGPVTRATLSPYPHRAGGISEGTMRKILLGAALAVAMVFVMGGTASAGEVTGNGKPTPINDYQAGSICSFSGQNDDPDEPGLFNGGRVQSFGDIVQEAIGALGDGKGASALVPIITSEGPGVSCRGYASGN